MADELQEWSITDQLSANPQNPRVLWNEQIGVRPIRSITIVNSTSATNVAVYRNPEAGGQPDFMVNPGAAITVPVLVLNGMSLKYVAQAGKQFDGAVYLHVTNQTLAASGTAGGGSALIGPGGSSLGGGLKQVFGIQSIVASPDVNGIIDTLGILSGNGPPGALVQPRGTIYQDLTNGDLWQCKTFVPGNVGVTGLMQGDGAWNLYRLNEAAGAVAVDSGPGAQNGTYSGTVGYGAAALTADNPSSILFDGASTKVQLPFNEVPGNAAHNNTSRYTIEGILHGDNVAIIATTVLLLGNTGVGGIDNFNVFGKHDAAGPYILNMRSNNYAPPQQPLSADGVTFYHHFAFTFDGVNSNWYIDGALVQNTNDGNHLGFGPAFANFWIGATATPSQWFKGTLQNIAFYKVALTAAQVLAHWNAITNPGASTWKKFQQI